MSDQPVRRTEYEDFVRIYEVRHREMKEDMKELENELRNQMRDLKNDVGALENNLSKKIDDLSNQVVRSRADPWKIIAIAVVSGAVGYVADVIQHLVHP